MGLFNHFFEINVFLVLFSFFFLSFRRKVCYNIGMIIDKIETKRNKTSVRVGENEYPFLPEILAEFGIEEGETDGKKFFEAKEKSDRILCRRRLNGMIERAEKSKQGYLDGLVERGFNFKIAKDAVDEAEAKGYIDDRRFAECYLNLHGKSKGWFRLAAELKQKGVSEEIVDKLKDDFGDHGAECAKCAEKFVRGLEATYENRQKVYAKLIRKGFTTDEIARALENFGNNGDID